MKIFNIIFNSKLSDKNKMDVILITNNQSLITDKNFVFITQFAGGYREVEIPSSIPNLEVKHFIADYTAPFRCGKVSRCQLLSLYKAFI